MNGITIFIPITRKELFERCIKSLKLASVEKKCSVFISINNPKIKKNDIYKIICKNFSTSDFVKIYKTKKFLKVNESWEIGVSKINSKWIMMLCEDDLLFHNSIEILEYHINKYKNIDCFTWPTTSIIFDHKKNMFRYSKDFKNYDMKSKVISTKEILSKIKNENCINETKKISPFFPKVLIKTKLIKKSSKFFFNSEPMWSSLFQILFKTKKYVYINFPIFVIGYLQNSSSEMHNKENFKKFSQGYSTKITRVKKFFPELDEYVFILSNRFLFLETLLHAKTKFGFDLKIRKKKIIESVKDEFLNRSIGGKYSFLDEIKKINKSSSIQSLLTYNNFFINYSKITNNLKNVFTSNYNYTKNYNDLKNICKVLNRNNISTS